VMEKLDVIAKEQFSYGSSIDGEDWVSGSQEPFT
jgi:hypothetical protein